MDNRTLIEDLDGDATLAISNMAADRKFVLSMTDRYGEMSMLIDIDQLDEMIKLLLDLQEESD